MPGDAYRSAEPDPLRRYVPAIVRQMNEVRRRPRASVQTHPVASPLSVPHASRSPPPASPQERIDDVARFVLNAGVEDAQAVELIWVDKAGFDVSATLSSGITRAVRVGFSREARPGCEFLSAAGSQRTRVHGADEWRFLVWRMVLQAINERDAISLLTLLAQQLWEAERQYKPQRPPPVTMPSAEEAVAAKA